MDIQKIGTVDATTLNNAYQTKTASVKLQPATDQVTTNQPEQPAPRVQADDQVRVTSVTLKNLDTVKSIEQMHARMNQMVKSVRETNEVLNKAAEQVSTLQSNLSAVKNFPPFPADSKERQDLLMSYSSIRQEILKMSVPPPPESIQIQVKRLWDSTVGQNGQILEGAVPALDSSSTGTQIQDATNQLKQTSGNLADLSSGITQALIGG